MKKGRLPLLIFLTAAAAAISFFFAPAVFMFISKQSDKMAYYPPQRCLEILQGNKDARTLFFCSLALTALAVWMMVFSGGKSDYRAELYSVTPDIRIPKPLGQYQHGSAWFMSGKEFEEMYPRVTINLHSPLF